MENLKKKQAILFYIKYYYHYETLIKLEVVQVLVGKPWIFDWRSPGQNWISVMQKPAILPTNTVWLVFA